VPGVEVQDIEGKAGGEEDGVGEGEGGGGEQSST
jgi:hypothetical protein